MVVAVDVNSSVRNLSFFFIGVLKSKDKRKAVGGIVNVTQQQSTDALWMFGCIFDSLYAVINQCQDWW
jgi:hypothetical protein